MDPDSSSVGQRMEIPVSIHAVFSRFRISPQGCLDFGVCTSGTEPEPNAIEITNLGPLPFAYHIASSETQSTCKRRPCISSTQFTGHVAVDEIHGRRANAPVCTNKARTPGEDEDVLSLTPFRLDHVHGTVEPGSTGCVSLSFVPQGTEKFFERLFVQVENAKAVSLQIKGESSVPMLDTTDLASIFEEHQIVRQFSPSAVGVYCTDENLFSFGPTVTNFNQISTNVFPAQILWHLMFGIGLQGGEIEANQSWSVASVCQFQSCARRASKWSIWQLLHSKE